MICCTNFRKSNATPASEKNSSSVQHWVKKVDEVVFFEELGNKVPLLQLIKAWRKKRDLNRKLARNREKRKVPSKFSSSETWKIHRNEDIRRIRFTSELNGLNYLS